MNLLLEKELVGLKIKTHQVRAVQGNLKDLIDKLYLRCAHLYIIFFFFILLKKRNIFLPFLLLKQMCTRLCNCFFFEGLRQTGGPLGSKVN